MMNGTALPAAPGAMPAGFAAFLAQIGQGAPTGDAAGFEQLLAAAPAPTPVAPTPVAIAAAAQPAGQTARVTADAALALDTRIDAGETPIDIAPGKAAVATKPSVAKPDPADGGAAAIAATLLVALGGAVLGQAAKAGKPPASETLPEAGTPGEAPAPSADPDASAIITAIVPDAIAAPIADANPAPADQSAVARPKAAPAAPAAAVPTASEALPDTAAAPPPRVRDAALAASAPLPGDAPAARPVDTGASITVLFAQPAAPASVASLDTAAPAIAERVLDMDSDGAWIDQLARDIAATKSDSGDISFRLMPRHLGRLDVAMQMGEEGVALKMDTQHEATATIVTAAQGRLVDELRQQGVRVAGAEVTHTPGEAGRQSQGQSQGRAAAPDPAHLIETASERAEPGAKTDSEERAANRRGRFA